MKTKIMQTLDRYRQAVVDGARLGVDAAPAREALSTILRMAGVPADEVLMAGADAYALAEVGAVERDAFDALVTAALEQPVLGPVIEPAPQEGAP